MIRLCLLVLCLCGPCLPYDSWIKGAINGARDYLESSPWFARALEGLQYAQMVDSALAEDCYYECPRLDQIPVPRKHHVPSANGCGSFGYLFPPGNKENWIYVEKEFAACCDSHDTCYDTCNADKDECDLHFKRCLYSTCRVKDLILQKKACQAKAKMFYLAVIGLGCQSYKEAQAEACQCVGRGKRDEL